MRKSERGTRNRSAALQAETPASRLDLALLFRLPRSTFRVLPLLGLAAAPLAGQAPRPRARDVGIVVGVLPPGPLDAITDVAGVRVGHTTVIRGDSVRTGVTVVLPPGDNVFRDKVPGAVYVGNAFGKLAGSTQVEELGEIETP